MRRRTFLIASTLAPVAAPLAVVAQPPRVPRVGVVHYSSTYAPVIEGLRTGLKELGLQEGRDLVLEVRDAKGDAKALEEIARRYERERVRLIHCVPTSAATAVKRATTDVPVVFCVGTDPMAVGLIDSFAKPGGRLTGVHFLGGELTSKRLELLKDLLPKLSRVVTFYNPGNPAAQASARMAREASEKLGIQLIERHVRSVPELQAALGALKPGDADALFMVSDALVTGQSQLLIDTAKAIRMPTMAQVNTLAERGALASYGVDFREIGRHSAKYVQRGGGRPAWRPAGRECHADRIRPEPPHRAGNRARGSACHAGALRPGD